MIIGPRSIIHSIFILERLVTDSPTVPVYRQNLATSHNNLGNYLLKTLGKPSEAEEEYRKALAIQERLASDFPNVPAYGQDLARTYNNLGCLAGKVGETLGGGGGISKVPGHPGEVSLRFP